MPPRSHWVKIDRALEHIETLEDAVKAWLDADKYMIRKQVKDQGTTSRTAFVVHLPDPLPSAWGAYIGDAAHNLRSALDHLAYTLNSKGYADAHKAATLPSREAQASEFPIFGDEDSSGTPGRGPAMFRNAGRKIAHVPARATSVIEALQPYKRGQDFRQDPLWLINELDRIDKHRELLLTAAAVPQTRIHELHLKAANEVSLGRGGLVRHGDELSHWVVPKGKEPNGDMTFTRDVVFGEGTPVPGKSPVELLYTLRNYVRLNVATQLDPFL